MSDKSKQILIVLYSCSENFLPYVNKRCLMESFESVEVKILTFKSFCFFFKVISLVII